MPKHPECDKCGGDLDGCKCPLPSGTSAQAIPNDREASQLVGSGSLVGCFVSKRNKYAHALKLLKHQKKGVEEAIARAEAKLEAADEMIEAAKAANHTISHTAK